MRDLFLSTGRIARSLIVSPEAGARWDEPSALDLMTVGALAAHLARAVLTVQQYTALAVPDTTEPSLTAAAYFAAALTNDLDDDLNRGIRSRSDTAAAQGRDAVVQHIDEGLASVTATLERAPDDAVVAVFGNTVMLLDEYLVTRLLELVVHLDDLAVSLGIATPDVDPMAIDIVTRCFIGVARIRHGDAAVVRALARRERAPADVFPVF